MRDRSRSPTFPLHSSTIFHYNFTTTPYVPPVKGGAGDASQFDKYPEETEEYGKKGDDP